MQQTAMFVHDYDASRYCSQSHRRCYYIHAYITGKQNPVIYVCTDVDSCSQEVAIVKGFIKKSANNKEE